MVLEKQEELIKALLSKSQQCLNLTPVGQLDINVRAELPKKYYVMQQKGNAWEKVSVSEILPEMESSDEKHRTDVTKVICRWWRNRRPCAAVPTRR